MVSESSPRKPSRRMNDVGVFLFWLVAPVVVGGVLGTLLFVAGHLVTSPDATLMDSTLRGLGNGAFFGFVWSPGIAIVVTVHRVWTRKMRS